MSNSIRANQLEEKELFMLANNQPYDDRPNPAAELRHSAFFLNSNNDVAAAPVVNIICESTNRVQNWFICWQITSPMMTAQIQQPGQRI